MALPGLPKGLFITGTDTGVGKTLIAAGLALALKQMGVDVGVMKPVETGCARLRSDVVSRAPESPVSGRDGALAPDDAQFLRDMAGANDDMSLINPYALTEPLAPAVAAQREGVTIDINVIRRAFQSLCSQHQIVIVEGAGGLLAPLTQGYFMADMAQLFQLPLVLVTRASLGTINHTLLSLSYARQRGLSVSGVLMNHATREHGIAEETNAEFIRGLVDCPFLGVVPFLPVINRGTIRAAFAANVDVRPMFS